MSYVLEALRRAEAERQRGHVPGLHAQTLPAPDAVAADEGPGVGRSWLPATVAAVAVLVVAALVAAGLWWWPGVLSADRATPVAMPAAPLMPEPPALTVVPRPVPAPVVRAPASPPAEPAAQAPDRVLPFASLPEALRRQVPAMAFGGSTYSPEPSARMLIINGQIWREGEQPAAGLTLERIELRSAQFRFRDQRFEVSY